MMNKTSDHALFLGLRALTYVLSRDNLLAAFTNLSGIEGQQIKSQAAEPAFLGAVLDFLFTREADFLAFCAEEDIKPDTLLRLRADMPGGPADLWL